MLSCYRKILVSEQASESIRKIQRENQIVYNRKRKKPSVYHIGDLVAIKRTQHAPGNKLKTKYVGPYKIIGVIGNDRYQVMKVGEHAGPRVTTTSVDNMKQWITDVFDVSHSDMSDDDINFDENLNDISTMHQGLMPNQDGRDVGPRSPIMTRSRTTALQKTKEEGEKKGEREQRAREKRR